MEENNGDKAGGKKPKRKIIKKNVRAENVRELIAAALEKLDKEAVEVGIKDRELVQENAVKLLELLKKDLTIDYVYETFREAAGLSISLKTFKNYLADFKAGAAPARATNRPAPAKPTAPVKSVDDNVEKIRRYIIKEKTVHSGCGTPFDAKNVELKDGHVAIKCEKCNQWFKAPIAYLEQS
jgi:hypothetical protein